MSDLISISPETIASLKKLNDIDQCLKVVPTDTVGLPDGSKVPVIRSLSHTKQIMAEVQITEKFPRTFCIYDLREFISAIGLVASPQLDFSQDGLVMIRSEDGKQVLRYREADENLISSYKDTMPDLGDEDLDYTVSAADFEATIKAAQIMKLEYIGFMTDDDQYVRFTAFNMNNGDGVEGTSYSAVIDDNVPEEVKFKMFYNLETSKAAVMVGEGDLSFYINVKKKISKIVSKSGKVFFIAMDKKSTFEVEE